MRKFTVSLAILSILFIYSIGIRHKNPVLAKPTTLNNNSNSSNTTYTAPNNNASNGTSNSSTLKDGSYTGSVIDAYYGNVQVQAIIQGSKIVNVKTLQYPNSHSTSIDINSQALPYLEQEAVQAQSAKIQIISGATYTSQAYTQSLANALNQALKT